MALLIIGRYFAQSGRDLQYLEFPAVGLRENDIATIAKDDEYTMMLRSAEFKEGIEAALSFPPSASLVVQLAISPKYH